MGALLRVPASPSLAPSLWPANTTSLLQFPLSSPFRSLPIWDVCVLIHRSHSLLSLPLSQIVALACLAVCVLGDRRPSYHTPDPYAPPPPPPRYAPQPSYGKEPEYPTVSISELLIHFFSFSLGLWVYRHRSVELTSLTLYLPPPRPALHRVSKFHLSQKIYLFQSFTCLKVFPVSKCYLSQSFTCLNVLSLSSPRPIAHYPEYTYTFPAVQSVILSLT